MIATHANSIYRSRSTMLLMLRRQGYDTSAYDDCSMSNIASMLRSPGQIDMFVSKTPGASDAAPERAYVWYCIDNARQAVKNTVLLQKVATLREQHGFCERDTLYIVGTSDAKDTLAGTIHDLWTEGIFVCVTTIRRTQFDLFVANLVYPHVRVSEEEKRRVAELHSITEKQWPEISRFDAAATAIGLRPGELVRIDRPDGVYYRMCISDVCRKTSSRK
jgi:DNA-directed RNA polymerase subunit H (RpoH/RPB5)